MATMTIQKPELAHVDGGGAPKVITVPAKAAATWDYGDILKWDGTAFKALKAAAADTPLLGIALSACPYVTRTDLTLYPVLLFTRDLLVQINTWATNTAADAGNTFAQTMIGVQTGYALALSGAPNPVAYVLDLGTVTTPIFIIEQMVGGIPSVNGVIGDKYVRVIARIRNVACAFGN